MIFLVAFVIVVAVVVAALCVVLPFWLSCWCCCCFCDGPVIVVLFFVAVRAPVSGLVPIDFDCIRDNSHLRSKQPTAAVAFTIKKVVRNGKQQQQYFKRVAGGG